MGQLISDAGKRAADTEPGTKVPPSTLPMDEPMPPKEASGEPDYFPGTPGEDGEKLRSPTRRHRLAVSWLQAH